MNIFRVDNDPVLAAQALVDRHVVKMIVESAQLLSTAHRVLDGTPMKFKNDKGKIVEKLVLADGREEVFYKTTHRNHPSAIWCRTSVCNYTWLADHFYALLMEYEYRYERRHKCFDMYFLLQSPPLNLKEWNETPIAQCMPDEYKISNDPLTNYRQYYIIGKKHLHKWKKRQPPEWMEK